MLCGRAHSANGNFLRYANNVDCSINKLLIRTGQVWLCDNGFIPIFMFRMKSFTSDQNRDANMFCFVELSSFQQAL